MLISVLNCFTPDLSTDFRRLVAAVAQQSCAAQALFVTVGVVRSESG
jgi:hypothetical protein